MHVLVRVSLFFLAAFALVACGSSTEEADSGFIDFDPNDSFAAAAEEPEATDTSVTDITVTETTVVAADEAVAAGSGAATSVETTPPTDDPTGGGAFPSVIAAEVTSEGSRSYGFAVTISSPYDSPERYADAWRVLGPDGEEYGIRILTHDHASEQPFTRSQSGISVPDGIDVVTIEGRDLVNGWGGPTIEVAIP